MGASGRRLCPLFYLFTANTALNMPVGVLLPALYSLGGQGGVSGAGDYAGGHLGGWSLVRAGGVRPTGSGSRVPSGMVCALALVVYELRDPRGRAHISACGLASGDGLVGTVVLWLVGPALVGSLVGLVVVGAWRAG